jgi:hypothetical protein
VYIADHATPRSGTTLDSSARAETACNSDGSAADGIEDDHIGQHERQDDGGCATFPVALRADEHAFRDAEKKRDGEERSAGLREPKPMAEPSPIASKQDHARILGQSNERRLRAVARSVLLPERRAYPATTLSVTSPSIPGSSR